MSFTSCYSTQIVHVVWQKRTKTLFKIAKISSIGGGGDPRGPVAQKCSFNCVVKQLPVINYIYFIIIRCVFIFCVDS